MRSQAGERRGTGITASRVERGWCIGSRWIAARLHAVHTNEPHRCSIELEGAWVEKRWAEGQQWHKGARLGESSWHMRQREMGRGATREMKTGPERSRAWENTRGSHALAGEIEKTGRFERRWRRNDERDRKLTHLSAQKTVHRPRDIHGTVHRSIGRAKQSG
jgi:hypothetical protein